MSGQGENSISAQSNDYENISGGLNFENISHSAIVVGDGTATVNIYNYGAVRKRPDYINMAPPPTFFVERPKEYNALKALLINQPTNQVAISATAALRGAGGFGKTTLAQALCYDPDIQAAYPDGILWVELGEHPDNLPGKVNALTYHLTDNNPALVDLNAAAAELSNALADKCCLLVIDDLWNHRHATPFLRGSPATTRLITTRSPATLPADTKEVAVEAMQNEEALATLVRRLPDWQPFQPSLEALGNRLGEWPLLLKLANGALFRRSKHIGLEMAIEYVETLLERHGLTAFDAQNVAQRNDAVAATMAVSLDKLADVKQARFKELAVFPEDMDIPISAVTTLWSHTGGFDEFATQELCLELYDTCSLLLQYDSQTIRLHDVIRQYLLDDWGDGILSLHQTLLDAYNPTADWPTGPNDGYYFQFLAYHLKESGKTADLNSLLLDFDYLWAKLNATGINLLLADFEMLASSESAPENSVEEALSPHELVESALQLSAHVLGDDKYQLGGQLRGRLLSFEDVAIQALCKHADSWRNDVWLSPIRPCLTQAGGPLIRTMSNHPDHNLMIIALTPDGSRLLSTSFNSPAKVWNLGTGRIERTISFGHIYIDVLAFSPNGKQVISGSRSGKIDLWNFRTGEHERTLSDTINSVTDLVVSPNGRFLVSASDDNSLKIWDLETGTEVRTLKGQDAEVKAITLTPDGTKIISGSHQRMITIWALETGERIREWEAHEAMINDLAVMPDGRHLVSVSWDQTVKIWDIDTGECQQTLTGHNKSIEALALTPDGRRIITASQDQTLKIWNVETGLEEGTMHDHFHAVNEVIITPDGSMAISASADNNIKVWELGKKPEVKRLNQHSGAVEAVAVAGGYEDGAGRAVSVSYDGKMMVWKLENGALEKTLGDGDAEITAVAVTPDGRGALASIEALGMTYWNLDSGQMEETLAGNGESHHTIVFLPDGKQAVSASYIDELSLWDLTTWKESHQLIGHDESVMDVALSPDGKLAVSGSEDESVIVWNLETAEQAAGYDELGDIIQSVAFLLDKKTIVLGSYQIVSLLDMEKREEIVGIERHTGWVNGLLTTPDGRYIISVGDDGLVIVWDGEDLRELDAFNLDQPLECAALTADGQTIILGDRAGQVIWLALHIPFTSP